MNAERAQAEAALIARVLAGESLAFEELVNAEQARLHQIAYRILRDHGDAEEVVQDTFTRAYRNLGGFRTQCSLRTWLHAIVVNTARNKYWYFRRRFRHATEALDEGMAVSAIDPVADTANRELADNLAGWLEELPACHREVMAARVLHYRSYDEIAAKLAINVGTVKSRLSRARQGLRRRWAQASNIRGSVA